MSEIILANKGDEIKVLNEEKEEWIDKVLTALGVPSGLSKEEMSGYLLNLNIEIWNGYDGVIDIYQNNEVIGQWKLPQFILIKDGEQFYYEIHTDCWARPLMLLDI